MTKPWRRDEHPQLVLNPHRRLFWVKKRHRGWRISSSRKVFSGPDEFRSSSRRRRRKKDHTSGERLFKNSVCVSLWPSVCVCGWLRCQENNVFRLFGGLSHAAPSVAPNTPRQRRHREREVMKSNRYFPFKVEAVCVCVWLHVESVCLSELGSL